MTSIDQNLRNFLHDLAARRPTPGGGSASAVVGALGTALSGMAAVFTTGNDKFKDVEPRALALNAQFAELRDRFAALIDDDMAAYEAYASARKLPQSTPDEKAIRDAARRRATELATAVPEEIGAVSLSALSLLESLTTIANPNMAADLAAAAYFLEAAARGAAIQVISNCAAPDIEGVNEHRRSAVSAIVTQCRQTRERIEQTAMKMLKL